MIAMYISTPKLSQRELIANMEATAAKLAGRAVTVRIRELPSAGNRKAQGLAQKDLTGRAVIDLDPAIFEDVQTFAFTFCHEAAHILLHFGSMPRRDTEKDVSADVRLQAIHTAQPLRGNPIVKRHEAEADTQAARWLDTVKQHHAGYTAMTRDPFFAVLQILYHKTGSK